MMYSDAVGQNTDTHATLPTVASGANATGETIEASSLATMLRTLDRPLYAARFGKRIGLHTSIPSGCELTGIVPAVPIESLGSRHFRETHGVRGAYVAGAMAGGIASVDLVIAMGKAGFLGFFGAGGVSLDRIEQAIAEVQRQLLAEPFGFNLLHNYFEPQVEMDTVELYLRHQVRCIEAAAFVELTPAVIYFRARGMRRLPDGRIIAPNRVFAKVSRPEVATRFMAPPSEAQLNELVAMGKISNEEAQLAAMMPVAEDITAEADSGGHTDQRPLSVLLPLLLREREQAMVRYGYAKIGVHLRVGGAGGIGDPFSANAALALGADYLLTGTVNQVCRQAATSPTVKAMLADADMADVVMAPAADMFELGARVQVLRRGTMYAQRAQRLYEIYRLYASFDAVPTSERDKIERQILQRPFAEVWAETERYWRARDPEKADEGTRDLKARMALTFRWYLGRSSRWASAGDPGRQADYQIWCGPAIGAFNRWAKGSWLEPLDARDAPAVGMAILYGTAALVRREAAVRAGIEDVPSAIEISGPPALAQLQLPEVALSACA